VYRIEMFRKKDSIFGPRDVYESRAVHGLDKILKEMIRNVSVQLFLLPCGPD